MISICLRAKSVLSRAQLWLHIAYDTCHVPDFICRYAGGAWRGLGHHIVSAEAIAPYPSAPPVRLRTFQDVLSKIC